MDFTAIGFDALKVMGGMGGAVITYFTIQGMVPKKPNGHAKCNEHSEFMKIVVESNTLLKDLKEDNKNQHEVLFEKVEKLEDNISNIKIEKAYSNGKHQIKKKKTAKELQPFTCLVIDDILLAAEATARLLETYLKDKIFCTHVTSVEEARKALKTQVFDFCFIDYFLNSSENGYDVYKFFKKAYPDMKCLIYSGQSPEMISPDIKDIYISKPFDRKKIIEKINDICNV